MSGSLEIVGNDLGWDYGATTTWNAAGPAIRTTVATEKFARFGLWTDGKHNWGPGGDDEENNDYDITLERSGEGMLDLTGSLKVTKGFQVGSPSGGNLGPGTINVTGDIYKNGTSYTNPDYVFEHWANGKIDKFKDNPGASNYKGALRIEELEVYLRKHLSLPGVHEASGAFERADILLEKLGEAYLYILQLHKRIDEIEKRLK